MMVPMATGTRSPIWPLPAVTRRRWTFGASRAKGARRHAGVDLYAPRGSVVLAPEAGVIVATQRFNGPNAVAVLLQTDTGPVILFGEVEPKSWGEFGLSIGSRVEAGDPVARVGINPGGDQMLHLEMYAEGTRKNSRWYAGQAPPSNLLDPTRYLKSAVALDVGQSDPSIEDDDAQHDHDHDDPTTGDDDPGSGDDDAVIPVDPVTPVDPVLPSDPVRPGMEFGALGKLALVFGLLTVLDEVDL